MPVACNSLQRPADIPIDKLPPYTGVYQDLFNDVLEPAAIGLAMDRPQFRGNTKFRKQAQAADAIVHVRVTTVTVDTTDSGKKMYRVQLHRLGKPLRGRNVSDTVEVEVKEGSPSFSLLRQLEASITGKSMLLLYKRFRVGGDEGLIHWYLAPDDADTIGAAEEDIALDELSGK